MNSQNVNEYMRLIYATEVVPDVCTDGSQCYLARNPELPGCMSHGATTEEAIANLEDARRMYISSLCRRHLEVPLPWSLASGTATGSTQTAQRILWYVSATRAEQDAETSETNWRMPSAALHSDISTLALAE